MANGEHGQCESADVPDPVRKAIQERYRAAVDTATHYSTDAEVHYFARRSGLTVVQYDDLKELVSAVRAEIIGKIVSAIKP